jgi:TolA-binding protein
MVESAAMSARSFSRKDLKHDEFVTTTGEIGRWLMERRHRIGWGLLAIVVLISIVAMVGVYRQRQEASASSLLTVAMEVYRAPIVDEASAAPAEDPTAGNTTGAEEGSAGAGEEGAEAAGEAVGGDSDTAAEAGDPASEGTGSAAAQEEQSAVAHNRFTTEVAKYEAAREEFAPIVRRYGSTPSGRIAAFYLGLCESSLGNSEAAAEALQQAAGASQEIISTLALYRLGQLQLASGNAEDAIASFDLLLSRSSDAFPADEALMSKARAQEAAGDLRGAKLSYQRVVDEHPESFSATEARTRVEELSAELGLDPSVEHS